MPRIGLKTAPIRVDWPTLASVWRRAGEIGCFDSAWLYDHFYPNDGDGACFEGTSALAALAPLIPGAQVGHLVLANPYRHPAVVAKMAATLDHVTGGRFVLGLGAGWHDAETAAYGIELPPIATRLDHLRSAVRLIRSLFSPAAGVWPTDGQSSRDEGGITIDAPPYHLRHARNDPLPIQGDRLPIWLGTQGERVGLRIAAELADGWNFSGVGSIQDFVRKRGVLLRHLDAAGREETQVEISAQLRVDPGEAGSAVARCGAYIEAGCQHVILYVDPRVGPNGINTIASEIVAPLRDRYT
jgi:alkanesulfonate monooxygenase SsuD/methylene tetrahydromethanopterin reductase-like flavin-dependent oxidoreductase (luciferase family)